MKSIVPEDSRYIPFTQQKSCCVPTCIQMIMYKQKVPLIPSEKIGYHLGLTVHPDNRHLYYNARVSKIPPIAGYGTQISKPKYNPSKALKKLKIPLKMEVIPANYYKNSKSLDMYLRKIELNNEDVLLCFDHAVLTGDPKKSAGHVVVFDRLKRGGIRIIDPSAIKPKWINISTSKMLNAMKKHINEKSGGVWKITKI